MVSAKRATLSFAVLVAALAGTSSAHADDRDLVLARLGTIQGGTVIGDNTEFRSLASELGVVLAPRLLAPADTLGFGGFEFTADLAVTTISEDSSYWRVLEGEPQSSMTTAGFFVRKGIWLPLPSFEVGLGAVRLGGSKMWAAQGYMKFALQEGYHELPLPSIAVRGAGSRMMGSEQLDLTVASVDVIASKDFGVGGSVAVTPYAGWDWLVIVPRSEVVDKTPHIDLRVDPADTSMNFIFVDQDNIYRNRFFVGAKLRHYVFTVAAEAAIAPGGSSTDDRAGTDLSCADAPMPTTRCDATDTSATQSTFTLALGLNF